MADTKHSLRQRAVLASVIVALFLGGALLVHVGRGKPASERPPAEGSAHSRAVAAAGSQAPSTQRAGMPVGFSHDQHGAVVAAVVYATASQRWLYFTDDQIRRAVLQVATPTAGKELTDEVVADVSAARKRLGASPGRVWWLVRPLAWQINFHDQDRARVSVWVVTVLSAIEVAAPQSEWMTVTIDLAWVESDWHVDAVRDAHGPTPMTGPNDRPWDAGPFDNALSNFTRMDGEPVR